MNKKEALMMAKKTTRKKKENLIPKKAKRRMFVAFLLFGSIISVLSYNFFSNINQILAMKKEKKELENLIVELQEEEEALKADVQKLEDPTYIARYAREKYLYSKDGELIIRMDDDDEE